MTQPKSKRRLTISVSEKFNFAVEAYAARNGIKKGQAVWAAVMTILAHDGLSTVSDEEVKVMISKINDGTPSPNTFFERVRTAGQWLLDVRSKA